MAWVKPKANVEVRASLAGQLLLHPGAAIDSAYIGLIERAVERLQS